jgi:hypothetical protein
MYVGHFTEILAITILAIAGKFSKVMRSRCENGLKTVEFSDPDPESTAFKFDPANNETFGDMALIQESILRISFSDKKIGQIVFLDLQQISIKNICM